MGCKRYPNAEERLITADSGGSNGYRRKLWKLEIQRFADEIGLNHAVSHFPTDTSKYNKIEHRIFSHINQNWRGRPLISHEVIVNLIANTMTKTGLKIKSELDNGQYPTGIKVSKQQMIELNLHRSDFWFSPQFLVSHKLNVVLDMMRNQLFVNDSSTLIEEDSCIRRACPCAYTEITPSDY